MRHEGVGSLTLLRRELSSWRVVFRWGIEVGEPPWKTLAAGAGSSITAARLPELRATGQRACCLLDLGESFTAWITSPEAAWRPSPTCVEMLKLIASRGVSVASVEVGKSRAATAAHDIRNQLSLALLRVERLDGVPDDQLLPLRGALRSGRSMCNAFLEGGGDHADFIVRPVLEDEIRAVLESSGRHDLSVSLRCGGSVFAHSSEAAVRRFIHNSLLNALTVTPDGAGIRVEATAAGPGLLELSVSDEGPGMDSAGVSAAFTFGLSGHRSTGVGSESLRQAAKDLGSRLCVSTAPGHGTRISVQIGAAHSERPVVLLLDRDPIRSAGVGVRLEELGWWVIHSQTCEEAAGCLERWGASLVLLGRGAAGGDVGEFRRTALDLGVPCQELLAAEEPTLEAAQP